MVSVLVTSNEHIGFSFVDTVSADGDNVTWENLNQTVDELKVFFITLFDIVFDEFDYINTRLNDSGIFASSGFNISINNSKVLERLDVIEDYLGYDGNATVYEDMAILLAGIVDGDGKYILRDENGNSILRYLFDNQDTLGRNQVYIIDKIDSEHNDTKVFMNDVGANVKEKIDDEGAETRSNGGSIWSVISGLGIIFLLLWIFFIKPRYFPRTNQSQGFSNNNNPPDDELPLEDNHKKPLSLKRGNPLSISSHKVTDVPPDCFRDGIKFDAANDMECATCQLKSSCQEEKMRHDAIAERIEENKTVEELPPDITLSNISPDAKTNLNDLDSW